jgi:hypothetical protein
MYQGAYYTLKISPNKYYPSWESMFTVYVGVSDRRTIQGNIDGTSIKVDKIIKVLHNHNNNIGKNKNLLDKTTF